MSRRSSKAKAFLSQYCYDRNVFLMIRYAQTPQLDCIVETVRESLQEFGLVGHLASDQELAPTLWENVRTHLDCCKYGIVVFEDIDRRDFNPNISLELGYMLAKKKPCLLLKEQTMPALPTDVVGHLYKSFDMFNISNSISRAIGEWAHNLGFEKTDTTFRKALVKLMEKSKDIESAYPRMILLLMRSRKTPVPHRDLKAACHLAEGNPTALRAAIANLVRMGILVREGISESPRYSLTKRARRTLAELG